MADRAAGWTADGPFALHRAAAPAGMTDRERTARIAPVADFALAGHSLGSTAAGEHRMLEECPILQQRFVAVGMEHFIMFKVKVEKVEIK